MKAIRWLMPSRQEKRLAPNAGRRQLLSGVCCRRLIPATAPGEGGVRGRRQPALAQLVIVAAALCGAIHQSGETRLLREDAKPRERTAAKQDAASLTHTL